MQDTFMSQKTGYGFSVSIQNPFTANIFSEDTHGPKPKIEKGQYVYISNYVTAGGKQEFVKRRVLAHQCCTHYVMFHEDLNEEPSVMKNHRDWTIWYLIQDHMNPLNIDWVKEKDLMENFKKATKQFDDSMKTGVVSQSLNPYTVNT